MQVPVIVHVAAGDRHSDPGYMYLDQSGSVQVPVTGHVVAGDQYSDPGHRYGPRGLSSGTCYCMAMLLQVTGIVILAIGIWFGSSTCQCHRMVMLLQVTGIVIQAIGIRIKMDWDKYQ